MYIIWKLRYRCNASMWLDPIWLCKSMLFTVYFRVLYNRLCTQQYSLCHFYREQYNISDRYTIITIYYLVIIVRYCLDQRRWIAENLLRVNCQLFANYNFCYIFCRIFSTLYMRILDLFLTLSTAYSAYTHKIIIYYNQLFY